MKKENWKGEITKKKKKMLKRGEKYDTYLTCLQTALEHGEIIENTWRTEAFSQHCGFQLILCKLLLQLMKASVD